MTCRCGHAQDEHLNGAEYCMANIALYSADTGKSMTCSCAEYREPNPMEEAAKRGETERML